MRTVLGTLVLLVCVAIAPARAGAPPLEFASDNVEFIRNVPDVEGAGASFVGDLMYMSTRQGIMVFDISNPLKPKLVGREDPSFFPYWPGVFTGEDPDSNGQTLIVYDSVYDVSDPKEPKYLAAWGSAAHTSTCVLDCRYAYDSEGSIVDLSKPHAPVIVSNWNVGTPATWAHDLTEVAPGVVVTASSPVMVLDARRDPTKPQVVATGETAAEEFVHGVLWPRKGIDRFLLAGGEDLGPRCDVPMDGRQASFVTYDTTNWRQTGKLRPIDEWRAPHGVYADGNAPVNHFCGHWFDEHPTFHDGGLVAVGWYDHGARFLRIDSAGKIKQTGYYMVPGGEASAAYWVTDRIVYVTDYFRGLDILRYKGEL